ncbi:MAG: hypothetical protein MJZ71_05975 [Bacteroidales bacterium]|nr:hypothetical protein [Bacteroidales bacterium]
MKYNISTKISPKMPKLGKGTECIKILTSQVSKDMKEAIVPMIFPTLGAFLSETEFLYPDKTWKEPCGQLAHLVAESGMGKGQLGKCVESIMRKFRIHDEDEMQKLVEWQKVYKTKGNSKDKPQRPEVSFWFPPADVTNPAFIQNAIACENNGNRTQYYNMPEVEMANRMCGGHAQVSQIIRNIYDCQRSGTLRATADGVTGNPLLRVNMTLSSTPYAARKFYKSELHVGTFGRVTFSYKARTERFGKIPRQGEYNEAFLKKIDEYLIRLESCQGRFVIRPLNNLIDQLAQDMATLADLADDDILWDISKRSIVSAWKCGCILYILNEQVWTRSMADIVEWLVYHDLWSKLQVFGDMFKDDYSQLSQNSKSGPKNMLDSLPDTFNEEQLESLRMSLNKPKEAKSQLAVWTSRGFIEYSQTTGLYTKTETYLKRKK